jgi:hypothetical protein
MKYIKVLSVQGAKDNIWSKRKEDIGNWWKLYRVFLSLLYRKAPYQRFMTSGI